MKSGATARYAFDTGMAASEKQLTINLGQKFRTAELGFHNAATALMVDQATATGNFSLAQANKQLAGAEKLHLELDLPYTQFLVDRATADADYAAEARQLLIGHALNINDAANIRITADQLASSITESANAAAVQGHANTVASSLSSGTQAIAGSLGTSGTALASAIQSYQQAEAQIQATHRTATQQAERQFQHDEDQSAKDTAVQSANETRDDALKTLREAYVTQEITLDGAQRVKVASEQLAHTNNVGQSRISTTTTIAGNLRDYLHDAADRDESFAHDLADLVVGLGENLAEERLAAHDAIFAQDDTPWGIRNLAEEVAWEDFMLTAIPALGVKSKAQTTAETQATKSGIDADHDRAIDQLKAEVDLELAIAGATEKQISDSTNHNIQNSELIAFAGRWPGETFYTGPDDYVGTATAPPSLAGQSSETRLANQEKLKEGIQQETQVVETPTPLVGQSVNVQEEVKAERAKDPIDDLTETIDERFSEIGRKNNEQFDRMKDMAYRRFWEFFKTPETIGEAFEPITGKLEFAAGIVAGYLGDGLIGDAQGLWELGKGMIDGHIYLNGLWGRAGTYVMGDLSAFDAEREAIKAGTDLMFETIEFITPLLESGRDELFDQLEAAISGDGKRLAELGAKYGEVQVLVLTAAVDLAEHFDGLSPYEKGRIIGYIQYELSLIAVDILATKGAATAATKSAMMARIAGAFQKLDKYGDAGKIIQKLTGEGTQFRKLLDKWTDFYRGADRLADGADASLTVLNKTCFVAGTPILTPEGSKPIESFKVGDRILSRPENQPSAPFRASFVEALFELSAPILRLKVGGKIVDSTAEHPFFVAGQGWIRANQLKPGDLLLGHNEQLTPVDSITTTDRCETVYNVRVAEDHTYFVGGEGWGFSVWVHNTYTIRRAADGTWEVLDDLGNIVQHQSIDRVLPGGHIWDRHAHEWFGAASRIDKPSVRQVQEWVDLIERVGRSKAAFKSWLGVHETVAHLAKVDGKWFVVHYYKDSGILAGAFMPNADQLAAMFRILGW